MLKKLLFLVVCFLGVTPSQAYERLPSSRDAVGFAISHAVKVGKDHPEDLPFLQFFHVRTPDEKIALDLALNYTSLASFRLRSQSVGPNCVVVNLSELYPLTKDLDRVLGLREAIVDPYFHKLRTIRTIIRTKPYKASDGKIYTHRVNETFEKVFALHLQGHDRRVYGPPKADAVVNDINLLADLLDTTSPILDARFYLARKALVTLDGGIYYDLLGWNNSNQDQVLQFFGASQQRAENARSDERAAAFWSGVTGDKPRGIIFFYGSNLRPSAGIPLITITEDLIDGVFDPRKSPIYNLLGAEFDASEGFGTLPNGFMAGWLANKQGQLQDVAPDTVAKDHEIPSPHTARLQPMISCIRCHASQNGYRDFPNHVKAVLSSGAVYDDLALLRSLFPEHSEANLISLRDRFRGLYGGDTTAVLEQARRDQAKAVFEVAGKPIEEAIVILVKTYNDYEYTRLTPTKICYELNYSVESEEQALALFNQLVPDLPVVGIGGFTPESATTLGVRAGIPISRREFEHIVLDWAIRSSVVNPK